MDLAGKTAVVIGGGGGIGREIVIALVRAGVQVLVGDVDEQSAAETVGIVHGSSVAFSRQCDIGSDASVEALADAAFQQLGRVDLVFNHAGASVGGLIEQVSSDDWIWLLNLNVVGLGRSIRAFLPRMTSQGGGWIINTSSGLGLFHDMPAAAPYIATKAAIIAYSRALAVYARNRGIGVSVFCPDITMTGFLGAGRLVGIPPEIATMGMPTDRMQRPEDAAAGLLEGLRSEQFLISMVPDTDAKLRSMAEHRLSPGSDAAGDPNRPIIQRGSVRIGGDRRVEAIDLCREFERVCRTHAGCIAYDIAASLTDPDVVTVFEVWRDQASINSHAFAPESIAFIGKLIELGGTDFAVAQVPF